MVTKLVLEACQIVLVAPYWKGTPWQKLLEKIVVRQFVVPSCKPLYKGDWDKTPLSSPPWETLVSFVDTREFNVETKECDTKCVILVRTRSKDWYRERLVNEMSKYPKFGQDLEISSFPTQDPLSKVISSHNFFAPF